MATFERVAMAELCVLLYGNAFRAIPASPAKDCGPELDIRVVLTHHYLVLTAFAAATLLLAVKTGVRALAAARPVAKAFDAGHEGIGSVAAGWKRRWLRGMLLLAVALSFAASVLADATFEDGFLYRTGCHAGHAGYGAGAPLGVLVMGLAALLHGFFAWAAVTQN